jgi:Pyruvate/2-oxoglutarate dehydrogenase complex, dehydrogenase (E1) component, eukaryotic type, beta subunit
VPWTKIILDKNAALSELTQGGLRAATYCEALLEAQTQLLETDESVFLVGEGLHEPSGVFGSVAGLVQRFGEKRVMDSPLAENGMTGIAIGAAMAGMKPIFIHMRMDFLPMCLDQIMNHAAKWNYMTSGRVHVPLVIRSLIGRGWGSAAQHSQGLHGIFALIPGLKVVLPSTPYDAKGLLIAAARDGNPVMFCEHRWLYANAGYVPQEMYEVPIGKGVVRRKGADATVVALSHMVWAACKAAEILAAEGIEVEVIDPRSVRPLDSELICESVARTGRLVIADVASPSGGVSAEIAACVAESTAVSRLKAPVQRVGFAETPTPCSPPLEALYYPDHTHIADAVRASLKG